MGTLNMRAVLAVVLACCAAVGAQNVVCKKGTSSNTVTIEDGKGYTFKTQKGKNYLGNTNCALEYKMGSTCTKMSFSCTKFNTNNRDKKRCKKGDKMTITVGSKARVYCKTKKPRVSSAGDIKVVFYSDKRGSASGAICKVRCTEAASSSTVTPTSVPTTTTAGPTEPLPCVNCTTEDGTACQFPFSMGSKTYTSCTMDSDTAPWCSTKVDGGGNHINGQGYWG